MQKPREFGGSTMNGCGRLFHTWGVPSRKGDSAHQTRAEKVLMFKPVIKP